MNLENMTSMELSARLKKSWAKIGRLTCELNNYKESTAYWQKKSFKAKAQKELEAQYREVLELIAAPMRPDGTWNRDREACRELAANALKKGSKE